MGHKAEPSQRTPAHEPLAIVVLSLLNFNDNLPATPPDFLGVLAKGKILHA